MTMYWGDYNTWHNKSEELRKKDVLSSQLIKQESSYVINENGENSILYKAVHQMVGIASILMENL